MPVHSADRPATGEVLGKCSLGGGSPAERQSGARGGGEAGEEREI